VPGPAAPSWRLTAGKRQTDTRQHHNVLVVPCMLFIRAQAAHRMHMHAQMCLSCHVQIAAVCCAARSLKQDVSCHALRSCLASTTNPCVALQQSKRDCIIAVLQHAGSLILRLLVFSAKRRNQHVGEQKSLLTAAWIQLVNACLKTLHASLAYI